MTLRVDQAELIDSTYQLRTATVVILAAPPTVEVAGKETGANAQELLVAEPMFETPWIDEEVIRQLQALPDKTPNVPFDEDDDL